MGLNTLSSPSVDSLDTLWDAHSREFLGSTNSSARKNIDRHDRQSLVDEYDSSVPEISDIDVCVINKLVFDQRRRNRG